MITGCRSDSADTSPTTSVNSNDSSKSTVDSSSTATNNANMTKGTETVQLNETSQSSTDLQNNSFEKPLYTVSQFDASHQSQNYGQKVLDALFFKPNYFFMFNSFDAETRKAFDDNPIKFANKLTSILGRYNKPLNVTMIEQFFVISEPSNDYFVIQNRYTANYPNAEKKTLDLYFEISKNKIQLVRFDFV